MNCCCCREGTASLKTGIYYGFFANILSSKTEQITLKFAEFLAEKRATGRKIVVFFVYPTQPEEARNKLQDLGLLQYVDEVRAVEDNDYAKCLGDMDEVYSMDGYNTVNEAIESARRDHRMLSNYTKKLFTELVDQDDGEVRIFGEGLLSPLPGYQ